MIPLWLKRAVALRSRGRKIDHFYSLYEGGTVLDVGISPGIGSADYSTNNFLKTFRLPAHLYTGLGIGDLSKIRSENPGKRIVEYPGGRFPFEDHEFVWAFSNAVVEHVGTENHELLFVREMARVAKNVFFTTPNKCFPVEPHTNVLFLHWLAGETFYRHFAAKHGYSRENLNLFSSRRLKQLMKRTGLQGYRIYRNRFLGLTMTFTVLIRGEDQSTGAGNAH